MGHRASLAAIATTAALLLLAGDAWGHAYLVAADPPANSQVDEAPAGLALSFSEPLETRYTQVRVVDRNGTPVDDGFRIDGSRTVIHVTLPPVPDGVYFVLWRALSVDTHTTTGSYHVAINATVGGEPPTPPHEGHGQEHEAHAATSRAGLAESGVRAAGFAAGSVAAGLPLFLLLFRGVPIPLAHRRVLRAWAAGGAIVAAAAALGLLFFVAGRIGADAAGVLATETGRWIGARAALFGAAGIIGLITLGQIRRDGPRRWTAVAAALAVLALLATGLSGHAAARVEGRVLAVAADWVHLAAVAFWIGGVGALIFLLPGAADPAMAAAWVRRFSPAAVVAVGVIVATGTYASFLHISTPADLKASAYGLALLTKMSVMVPLLGLGWYNRYRATPRVETGDPRGIPRLRMAATAEALLMGVALVAAGLLANTAPPAAQGGGPAGDGPPPSANILYNTTLEGIPTVVTVEPYPPRLGPSNLTATFETGAAAMPANAAVFITLWPPSDPDGEGRLLELEPSGPASWSVTGSFFTEPGSWRARLILQGRGAYDTDEFAFQVSFG